MTESSAWSITRRLPSRENAIDTLLSDVLSRLEGIGWLKNDQFCVRLALEEAFNNAREHGNRGDEAKHVTVKCLIDGNRFWASVVDEGEGFDPQQVADCTESENLLKDRGRGVFLMRTYMDIVQYNDVGNQVILEKRVS